MQTITESDSVRTKLRNAHGFVVPPAYEEIHRQFEEIWAGEEIERTERWQQWFESYREMSDESGEDDAQLLQRALLYYSAANFTEAAAEATNSTNITPQHANLLHQLRALAQMGVPHCRRAAFWRVFLNIDAKKRAGEYAELVAAALAPEMKRSKSEESGAEESGAADSPLNDGVVVTQLSTSSEEDSLHSLQQQQQRQPMVNDSAAAAAAAAVANWLPVIDKDLHRTFPDHPVMDANGRAALRRILGAYSIRNPAVGYCQGQNFIAAAFMLIFDEEEAFWCLCFVLEDLLPGYFDSKMVAAQVDGLAFAHLLRGAAPRVAQHLDALEVDIPSATAGWFLVAFINSLPMESCLRVWDVLLFENSAVVLFRVALSLIEIYSQALLQTDDSSEAYLLLQSLGPMSFDASRLVDAACIGFAHVKDSALRVLCQKFLPEVVRAMAGFAYFSDAELETCFETATADAASAPLSRSQSFIEALAASGSLGLPHPLNHTASMTLCRTPPSPPSPLTSHSPLSSPTTTKSPVQRPSPSPSSSSSSSPRLRASPRIRGSSPPRSPGGLRGECSNFPPSSLGPCRTAVGNLDCGSPLCVKIYNVWSPPPISPADLTIPYFPPRRTQSAAAAAFEALSRTSSIQHYQQQRGDLSYLYTTFVPDLKHPKVAALYQIATKPPVQRLKNASSRGGSTRGGSEVPSPSIPSHQQTVDSSFSLPLAALFAKLEQNTDSKHRKSGSPTGEDGVATLDMGSLPALIKALKYGQTTTVVYDANSSADSSTPSSSSGVVDNPQSSSSSSKKRVLRRFTDGGALLQAAAAASSRKAAQGGVHGMSSMTPLQESSSAASINEQQMAQLRRLRDELAAEVQEAGRRQAEAAAVAAAASETAQVLHQQLAKIQTEIDSKVCVSCSYICFHAPFKFIVFL